jgi:hypothetical protein
MYGNLQMFPSPTTPAIDAITYTRCDDQTGRSCVPVAVWFISDVVFGLSID